MPAGPSAPVTKEATLSTDYGILASQAASLANDAPAGIGDPLLAPARGKAKPRRILFLDHTAAMSGGEIALLNLIRHLDRSRFTPIVALFSHGPLVDKLRQGGVETHVLELPERIAQTQKDNLRISTLLRLGDIVCLAGFAIRLALFTRRLKINLIHANSLKADVIGGVAGRLAGVKIIWHIRDRIADDYLPASVAWIFRRLCRILPHFVVANSYATLSALDGLNPGRTAVVSSGSTTVHVSSGRYHVVHDGMNSRFGEGEKAPATAPRRRPVIGLVGRLSPWKGQHIFLRAAALVRKKFPEARFQIVGSAMFSEHAYEAQIRELTAALGLQQCVEFTGFRENVGDLIAAMDLLVHASTLGEPFGQVVIEGMAFGKPVVATNGGGIPEIVEDGITGILVPMSDADAMADAICGILADPQRAEEMGRRGRERVQTHFTIQQTVARVESIYQRIIPDDLRRH